MATIKLTRANELYAFDAVNEKGNVTKMDAGAAIGGVNYGASPMDILLSALAGCSSIDVLSILKKKQQNVTNYEVTVQGEKDNDKTPSVWEKILITYLMDGEVTETAARRAIELSLEKYCSVAATLKAAGATIQYKLILNGKML